MFSALKPRQKLTLLTDVVRYKTKVKTLVLTPPSKLLTSGTTCGRMLAEKN